MKKTEQELTAEGWQKTDRHQNTFFKRIGRHFLFCECELGILFECDLNVEFKLQKDDKRLNDYLNFAFHTPGQRNSGQKYREKYKDWEFELALHCYKIKISYPSFINSPEGKRCYAREMITTDDKYLRGMKVIVEVETEKILLKHFDNVISNAIDKGFKR